MKRLWFGLMGAALALASPAAAGSLAVEAVEIRTSLRGLAPGEGFLVRAAETRRGAPPAFVSVVFLNERNVVVRRASGIVTPGAPITFQVERGDLPPGDPYPAVRAVLRLTHEDALIDNEPFLTFEFFDKDGPTHRNGGSCVTVRTCPPASLAQGAQPDACVGPPARGGGPITHCEGGAFISADPNPVDGSSLPRD